MSDQVQEIEVKYRVLGGTDGLEAALAARGAVLSAPVRQDDQAYAPETWNYGDDKQGVSFARLRTQDGRHLFTIKTPVANELAVVEHETTVGDREQMHHALLAMGFRPTMRIVKTRRTARLESGLLGVVSVCVDEVEHAGLFVEFEAVTRTESGEAAQEGLDVLARSLGVELERETVTYDLLVRAAVAAV
ncbi:class IV adenylate cyclase [Actinomadura viridis]|uniref:class IV adenylate cyclase n=1 Tax=Actinomadura viridis TaxID=58110 RepID=UPI003674F5A3